MKNILRAYRKLLGLFRREAPTLVPLVCLFSVVGGLCGPLATYAQKRVFDDGLRAAQGLMPFSGLWPCLALLAASYLLPPLIYELYIYGYAEPRAALYLQSSYKGEMMRKLARLKYEHFENPASVEVMDKATSQAPNSARHLFPMYLCSFLGGITGAAGYLIALGTVRWYLLLTTLFPFALQTMWDFRYSINIYEKMNSFWKVERRSQTVAGFLKSRDSLPEAKMNAASPYLIGEHKKRVHERNVEYEGWYKKNLKTHLVRGNVCRVAALGNAIILLVLFARGDVSLGALISLSLMLLTTFYETLNDCTHVFHFAGMHIQNFDYYERFFALSEDEDGEIAAAPSAEIEFRNVWFRYPGADTPWILRGLSFRVAPGEKVSLVGENGEGKSTAIKLLLRLFEPTRGQILLGGKPLSAYSRAALSATFAPVFQDFVRYSMTARENIAAGGIARFSDDDALLEAARKAGAELPGGLEQMLGRDFEGGIDLSGGQWQRVAAARAFLGDKPVLLLDEPASQLDPMAESRLYEEFHTLCAGKSALFITHRLASTKITDRILVLAGGKVAESGTHEELMRRGGLYARMFDAQKSWYTRKAV